MEQEPQSQLERLEAMTVEQRFELGRDAMAKRNEIDKLLADLNDISERENW